VTKILKQGEFEQAIGQAIGTSDWFEVTQEAVNTFADVTKDHQYIHVDQEKAAHTPFGGTIAHGFFTMSMLSHFSETGCGVDTPALVAQWLTMVVI